MSVSNTSLRIHDPYQEIKTMVVNKLWLTNNFPHSIQGLVSEVPIILLCHWWHKGNVISHPPRCYYGHSTAGFPQQSLLTEGNL